MIHRNKRGFDNAVKAIKFIHDNRTWTIQDLTDHLGVDRRNGYSYRDAISVYYPVRKLRTVPSNHPTGGGVRPSLYTIYSEIKTPKDMSRILKERRDNAIAELKEAIATLESMDV